MWPLTSTRPGYHGQTEAGADVPGRRCTWGGGGGGERGPARGHHRLWSPLPAWRTTAQHHQHRQAGPLTPATITEPPGWTGKYLRSVLLFAPSQQLQDYILRHDHETRILCRRNGRRGWKYFKNIFVTPSSPPSTSDNEPA